MKVNLTVLKDIYAIYRFNTDADIPAWIKDSEFYSLTKTQDEISIVCKQNGSVSKETIVNKDWRILKIQGPLDFSMVGVIADISGILAKSQISIFTTSTFDTDYISVKGQNLNKAIDSLKGGGHEIIYEN